MTSTPPESEIDAILKQLEFSVMNYKITETEWESKVWFKITDEFKAALSRLIAAEVRRARIDELEGWMQIVSCYPNTSNVLEPLQIKMHRRHDELEAGSGEANHG